MNDSQNKFSKYVHQVRSGAAGWGTALQAVRLEVRFPRGSLEFLINSNFQPHYGPGVNTVSNGNEYQVYLLVVGGWGVNAVGA
jgi:hypothetical protein